LLVLLTDMIIQRPPVGRSGSPAPDGHARHHGATGAIAGADATALARRRHQLVLLGRDPSRLSEAARLVCGTRTRSAVEPVTCDISSLASVRAAATAIGDRFGRIDALVHSAAVFVRSRSVTSEGNDRMLATKHLRLFLLTDLLLERPRTSAPARLVVVSAPSTTELDFEDFQGEKTWGALTQFGRSRMANPLFTFALARRQPAAQVTANVLFPGLVKFGLMKDVNAAIRGLSGTMSRFPEAAGDALTWLTVDPSSAPTSGQFCKLEKLESSNAYSRDVTVQDRLWPESARPVGLDPSC
jgi:NAD(P)-dependent dehydrogenase (short-subunit alcohol dehydrogenase family)